MERNSEIEKRLEAIAAYLRVVPDTNVTLRWPEMLPRVWTIEIDRKGTKAAICYEESGRVYVVKYTKEHHNPPFSGAEMHMVYDKPHDAVKELFKGLGL